MSAGSYVTPGTRCLLRLSDGRILHSLVVLEPLRAVPGVAQVQVIQREMDRFLLRLVVRRGADQEETRRRLAAAFQLRLGCPAEVQVECVAAIPPGPNGKVKAAISG